ncbi:MAG: MmyB family transcriptional regulator [Dermabacteraceae bacterium]
MDHYARLEQGHGAAPSAGVATAIARALQCDRDQSDHLLRLAGHPAPPWRAAHHVRPGLIAMGNRLSDIPVLITTDLGEVLWSNRLNHALIGDLFTDSPRGRNLFWQWFVDPSARPMPRKHWERISAAHVSGLRAAFTRRGGDSEVSALITDLQARSDEFARLWALHDVAGRRSDLKVALRGSW